MASESNERKVIITILLVTAVGMAASISILRSKPIQFLRAQTEEE